MCQDDAASGAEFEGDAFAGPLFVREVFRLAGGGGILDVECGALDVLPPRAVNGADG